MRVDTSDLMRYAGYIPDDEPEKVRAKDPLHQLLEQASRLTVDELIVLIDHAWEKTGAG